MDIFVLVDMQNDFLLPEGKLWIGHNTTEFVARVEKTALTWGLVYGLLDTHQNYSCELKQWPGHCIEGTWGWKSVNDFYDKLCIPPIKKDGFVSYKLIQEIIKRLTIENCTIHFAGVLASICVQENVAALYNLCKHEFNRLPNIVINPELIDDITSEAKEAAIKRMVTIYNVKIMGQ